ncbi:M23 family metallopeptidase [Mammaliicoccus sciuri]|uniref:M23 family metallopeptidase n=1 Tax=Sporosarcina newyorkensis TaxID=759851 RepID=UPI00349727BD
MSLLAGKSSVDGVTPTNFSFLFLNGDSDLIYKQCVKEFQRLITAEQLEELITSFNENVTSYSVKFTSQIGPHTHYIWVDVAERKAISVYFDEWNQIHRLLIKPYERYPQTDAIYSKQTYTMPVKEDWTVFWGGANEFLNYHYEYENQRYAYDLVITHNGETFSNNRLKNENFHAFSKKVYAPNDGKVIKTENTIRDNIPGEMNEEDFLGNYVIIKHEVNEYSLIAHLKRYSITVQEGANVKTGELIGLCGNSGNSSEPHIHFQVMDNASISKGQSIRMKFHNGKEPIQGDLVNFSAAIKEQKLDSLDKAEMAFTLSDILLFIPRLIVTYFKS